MDAARCADLRGLPPARIGVGELDLFHDENHTYAERLARNGVESVLLVVVGAPHDLDALAPDVPLARACAATQRAFLQGRWAAEPLAAEDAAPLRGSVPC
jgi:acetyl esterase/lipase